MTERADVTDYDADITNPHMQIRMLRHDMQTANTRFIRHDQMLIWAGVFVGAVWTVMGFLLQNTWSELKDVKQTIQRLELAIEKQNDALKADMKQRSNALDTKLDRLEDKIDARTRRR